MTLLRKCPLVLFYIIAGRMWVGWGRRDSLLVTRRCFFLWSEIAKVFRFLNSGFFLQYQDGKPVSGPQSRTKKRVGVFVGANEIACGQSPTRGGFCRMTL